MALERLRVRFGLFRLMAVVAICALVFWFFREDDPMHQLTKGLRSANAEVRTTAINELRLKGAAAVPALIEELE